tara:strand:- start:29753 stop:30670 length:918 start_codon:yes stop_codon:yes gene_type:complete
MIVVRPNAVTDALFVDASSNVPENDNTLWDVSVANSIGDKVMMTTGVHKNFECLIANTTENPSLAPVNGSGDPYWLDLGATNRWAMFDEVIGNQTTNTTSIVFEVSSTTVIDTIGLLNIAGSTVNITGVNSSSVEFYNQDFEILSTENVFDAYSYFFAEFISKEDIIAVDIPPFLGASFTITITGSGTVALGEFVYGSAFELGASLVGAQPFIESFSTVTRDAFGNVTKTVRSNTKGMSIDTAVLTSRINNIHKVMREIIDINALWVGSPDNSALIIYGIMSQYSPAFGSDGSLSFTNYEITGLI